MRIKGSVLLLGLIISLTTYGQVVKKKLPRNLNIPNYSHVYPSLTGDGMSMIYMTNYNNTGYYQLMYTTKTGPETWEDPVAVDGICKPHLDHLGSYSLSYDGKTIVFSSRRSPNIGNFDIWISEKKGNVWGAPVNPGKPLNTPGNEGNPSLSPDGKKLFFMRCESMDVDKKSGCKIYVSERNYTASMKWSEPVALPEIINTGNVTSPRMLSDKNTLIFSSDRPGGAGGLDLYMSRYQDGNWSDPEPFSFINNERNNELISIPAKGDIMYYTDVYRDQFILAMALIPESLRAKNIMMIKGKVTYSNDGSPATDALIQAFNIKTNKLVTSARTSSVDGSYLLSIPEGGVYDFSIYPLDGTHTFYSKIYDLTHMESPQWEIIDQEISTLKPGITMLLPSIRFEPYTSTLTEESDLELKRLAGLMKKNPNMVVEVGAYIDKIYQDSIPSSQDLTEVITDTVYVPVNKNQYITDTTTIEENTDEFDEWIDGDEVDLIGIADPNKEEEKEEEPVLPKVTLDMVIDSLHTSGYQILTEEDSMITFYKVHYTYHNDRTEKQAKAIVEKMISQGAPANRFTWVGYGDKWKNDLATEERNYWIELKIISQ